MSHKKEPDTKAITFVTYEKQTTKDAQPKKVTVQLRLSQADIGHCLLFGPAKFIKPADRK